MARFLRLLIIFSGTLLATGGVFAEEKSSTDKAREALAQQGEDESDTAQLEEVFQAADGQLPGRSGREPDSADLG